MAARARKLMLAPLPGDAAAPEVGLRALDTVWLQLTGTLCNIACRHCFISCGPKEERVPMMTPAAVLAVLDEAERLGVRDYYFTGGEPMLHPQFWSLCAEALRRGPLTVLSNGILVDDAAAAEARALFDGARYSFDLRISLDGMSAEENDAVRGRGTFDGIVAGLGRLAAVGLSPTITVVEHQSGMAAAAARARFFEFMRGLGLRHPRLKYLPLLRIGREQRRTHGYADADLECLRQPLPPEAAATLVCASARLATTGGVYTCPILLDAPDARLGSTLAEAAHAIRLRWSACRTCVVEGLSCHT